MEKRLIKKDALAGIARKMAGDMPVWAPVKKEDNVLFAPLGSGDEPFFAFLNSRTRRKMFSSLHGDLMKFTRTPGIIFRRDKPGFGFFGVRPCDAHSFVLLDKLFDQEKYKDAIISKTENDGNLPGLCQAALRDLLLHFNRWRTGFADGADILQPISEALSGEFITEKGEKLAKYFGTKADAAADTKKSEIAAKAREAVPRRFRRMKSNRFWTSISTTRSGIRFTASVWPAARAHMCARPATASISATK